MNTCREASFSARRTLPERACQLPKHIVVAAISTALCAPALALPVVGGPTYSPAGGGFMSGIAGPEGLRLVSGGFAVGPANKYSPGGSSNGGDYSFRVGADGTATQLANLGADNNGRSYATALAINPAGEAVGYSTLFNAAGSSLGPRAVRWDASGNVKQLAALDPANVRDAGAIDINASGWVVGYSGDGGGTAVRWNPSGAITALDDLDPTGLRPNDSVAFMVNASGTAMGSSVKYDSLARNIGYRAVRWNAGQSAAIELGTLGTDTTGSTFTQPLAINDGGTVVGIGMKYTSSGAVVGARGIRWDGGSTVATELDGLHYRP
jgi:hypothetical protein